ncbi:oxidoreductase [Actinotalea ferrariae CF5-4]|uniref:Oxidoreductase n=1 Tax=Actinotalea ferrariae CF5-4 TaxID=948458 RepID=A0A021VUY1_9CELL|nr:mannitol dehydrogenase family protein [Actinotalea ferrariae]EYR64933.1 oxidoreductase [Actinotalea ferrariae CF5-4]
MTTSDTRPAVRLSRVAGLGRPAAPVRIVHLGLGNFFRAHQAWYTEQAPDREHWGIAAFTGRSARLADLLTVQEGLYSLITRAPDGPAVEVVSCLSAVHAAADHAAWLGYWRDPRLAVVTLTITEAGYLRGPDGGLDAGRADVLADVDALRADPTAPVTTGPARLVAGFLARRAADAGALTLLPCDNLPHNGPALQRVLEDLVALVDPALADWVEENVVVASTMVDRITPATTDEDRATVRALTGVLDDAPVPTEPFSEWVVQGHFPRGRPRWEDAGARFVDDVAPFEQRKLWLLNGSHSLLAYAGGVLGHRTVAEAVADPVVRGWVEEWWDEAAWHLPLPPAEVADYREALLERFGNANVRHELAQIAADGSQKLPVRILPVLRAERAAGRLPGGAVRVLAAWVAHLRGAGVPVTDVQRDRLLELAEGPLASAVPRALVALDPEVAEDREVVDAVTHLVRLVEAG